MSGDASRMTKGNYYTETVEAVQLLKGQSVQECLALLDRAGFQRDWVLSADSLRFGGDGYDGHAHYLPYGDWLVMRQDNAIHIVSDKEFTARYTAVPRCVERAP